MADTGLQACLPMRMLIVDDDELIVAVVTDHYRGLGFEVETAPDGAAALRMMEQRLPDIVLCDRRMPGVSGADLLETMRSRSAAWQRVVFVFMTALSDHRDRFSMLPLHPDGYVCKPIDFEHADRELQQAIGHARARLAA